MSDEWLERTWRPLGRTDAYFGVLTDERFRAARLDPAAREAFFRTGDEHVDMILAAIRRHIVPDFAPTRVLDFGCGVGRLVLPFARTAKHVVGVDISPEMLAEAKKNADQRGIDNASFVLGDDELRAVDGTFDLVHSYIVFQHIPTKRGEQLARRMVAKLSGGGVAALHFTYRREAPVMRKIVNSFRRRIPGANALTNIIRGRAAREPYIPMHEYDLERLIDDFRAVASSPIVITPTDHGGYLGAILLFRVG